MTQARSKAHFRRAWHATVEDVGTLLFIASVPFEKRKEILDYLRKLVEDMAEAQDLPETDDLTQRIEARRRIE